jgi:hypothetical protein
MLTAPPASALPGPTGDEHDQPLLRAVSPVAAVHRDDLPGLADLAAAAAVDAPLGRWLVPEAGQREAVLRAWYLLLLDHALRYGRIDMLADRSGVAAWVDRTGPVPDRRGALRRLTATCGKHTIALLGYHDLLHRHRPASPHLELAVMAADPASVARLLAHRHRRLDRAGIGTHAFADNPDLRRLLAAAGYQAGQPVAADAGVQLWPMWRPPVPARPGTRPVAPAGA